MIRHFQTFSNYFSLFLARDPLRQGPFQYYSKTAVKVSPAGSMTNAHISTSIHEEQASLEAVRHEPSTIPLPPKFCRTHSGFLNYSIFKNVVIDLFKTL